MGFSTIANLLLMGILLMQFFRGSFLELRILALRL